MKRSHPVQVTLKEIFNRKSCKLVEPAFNFSGFTVINTPPDGQCMFSALAHQLSIGVEITDTPTSAIDVRKQLVIIHNKCIQLIARYYACKKSTRKKLQFENEK